LGSLSPAASRTYRKNNLWLGPLQLTACGENWLRNRHNNAGSAARLGGLRCWQTDIGWDVICALEAAGLASRAKRPRACLPDL
jgi:fatty-acid desaturase